MIDLDILNGAIAELEQKELTFNNLSKLATLYIVKDAQIYKGNEARSNAEQPRTIPLVSESEFIQASSRCDSEKLWMILDELLLTIQMLYPKLYDETLKAIKSLI